MKKTRTPLRDVDQKIDLIDHINDDHPDEVLAIAQTYGDRHARQAKLIDIFTEGCLLRDDDGHAAREWFVPFVLKGDWEENILYLAYDAMVRQGKPLSGSKKQYFTVLGSKKISPHMLRLYLKSSLPLNQTKPGDAWFFSLKTLGRQPDQPVRTQDKMSKPAQWGGRLMLWYLKHLSSARREKVLQSFSKGMRYYSLRAVTAAGIEVDVFLHGDTPGGRWAESLKAGDIIHSTAEYREHTDHLHQGAAILIGDETALPAVAAILAAWRNPQPPTIISITADAADQCYLDEAMLPAGSMIHRISAAADVAAAVMDYLQSLGRIDTAWGALENEDAKVIRRHLRRQHHLEGKKNRIKAYWRRDKTTTEE